MREIAYIVKPPSTCKTWPVTYWASTAKNFTAVAMSCASPKRFSGICSDIFSESSPFVISVWTNPGATAFTRIFLEASSFDNDFVNKISTVVNQNRVVDFYKIKKYSNEFFELYNRYPNTEEISKKVKKIITQKSGLHRRLVEAFPNIKAKVNLKDWITKGEEKINELKNRE